MSVKAILFDLDGTLADTAPDLGYAANCVREQEGLSPLPIDLYRPVASSGARGLLGVALNLTPQHVDYPRHRDSFLQHYRAHLSRSSHLFDGVDELLHQIEARGLRWGVVTNKPGWLTRPLLDDLQLSARAACAISGDDVPKPKPAPDSLLKACAQMQLAPAECIYVGDDKRDIDAGRAAGMRTAAAQWGYLGADGPITEWLADVVVEFPRDVVRLL